MGHFLHCGPFQLDLRTPQIMGIINVTPDSFSDGGKHMALDRALAHGRQLIAEGAAILDVGGESTRPGAQPVSPQEELQRVLPVVKGLAEEGYLVSIDTRHTEVMIGALKAGAAMVNDVNGLRADGAIEACAESDAGVCIMHMQGDPLTMQIQPTYDNVVLEVTQFLKQRADAARAAGINMNRICLDPGFGFGKTVQHNLELLRGLSSLMDLGYPLLAGLSRKSVLGAVTGKGTDDRVHSSIAAALIAIQRGARIVRVHDVAATHNALAVWSAVEQV
jgi:dihydropteroate synthase